MRERIEHEEFYRQSQNKFRNGDLSNFNEHTRRNLQRIQSPHQPAEETLAPDQEAILAVLEENSKMLKAKDNVGLASSKY